MYSRKESLKGNPHNCVHYWIVDPPDDVTSVGRCCKCMSIKKFNNVLMNIERTPDEGNIRNRSSWLFAE